MRFDPIQKKGTPSSSGLAFSAILPNVVSTCPLPFPNGRIVVVSLADRVVPMIQRKADE